MGRMNCFNVSAEYKRERMILEARMVTAVKKGLYRLTRESACDILDDTFGSGSSEFSQIFMQVSLDTLLGGIVELKINKRKLLLDSLHQFLSGTGVPDTCYKDFKKALPRLLEDNMKFFDVLFDDDIYYFIDLYLDNNSDSLVLVKKPEDTKYFSYVVREADKKHYDIKNINMSYFVKDNPNSYEEKVEKPASVFIDYIESYKELNQLANDRGFSLKRVRGDHAIFENDKGMITVIPQRTPLGKGLSYAIQKTILG